MLVHKEREGGKEGEREKEIIILAHIVFSEI
jgi:hypothetical protein